MTDKQSNLDKGQSLEKTMSDIVKRYGENAIARMGEFTTLDIDAFSTGSTSLDLALGIGGIPRGRISELYGPESSGKTTILQHIIAECQKAGGTAALIDAENAVDRVYAAKTGVDVEKLLLSQPGTGEEGLEIVEYLVRSKSVDLIAVDSVAALVPRAELEGDMGDASMGGQARLMSQAMRKLSKIVKETNTAVIFTNQIRMKIGVMFGNPETQPGGLALKFYASVRMDIRKIEQIKEGQEVVGIRSRVRVVKNKVARPHEVAEISILFGQGIDKFGDLRDAAIAKEVIKQSGAFYQYEDREPKWRGKEAVKTALQSDPALADEILRRIKETK